MRVVRLFLYGLAAVAVFLLTTTIAVTVFIKDTESVVCPDTVGKDFEEARRIAERNGLVVVVARYEKTKDIPYNEVIAQRPEASMTVRKGRAISLVVSEGPVPISIPDLTNHPLEMAQNILREKSLKLKNIVYVPSTKEGRVIGQSPRTGSQIMDEEGMVLFVGQRMRSYFIMPGGVEGVSYGRLIEEFDRNQVEYRLNFAQRPDLPAKTVLHTSVPSRRVFGSDEMVQITVNLGG